jgi:hypothetical protein
MPEYKLDFPVSVGSAAPVRSLSDAVREVADRTKLGEGNLRLFNQLLTESAQRSGSLNKALGELAGKTNPFKEFAKDVQAFVKEQEKAQSEAQKMGRIMEQAYGENARRAQKEVQQLGRDLQNLSKALPGGTGLAGQGLAGLFGVGGGGAVAAAAGGAGLIAMLTGAATLMVKLASETGQYAREQENLAARTGLTLRETQEFSQMAQVAGVNVGSLTTAMRTLSKGLSENSEDGKQAKQALKELGLDASVAFEPTGRAMKEIFERLGAIGAGVERDRLAISLFGRGGLELLPLVEQFKELEQRVKSAGNVMDEAGIKKAAEYQRQVTLLGQSWDQLKRTMGEKAIGIIQLTMGGKDLSIGGIADTLLFGGAIGTAQSYLGSPGRPPGPGLPSGMPDPFALIKQQRAGELASMDARTGTPRQQLEAQLHAAEQERQAIANRYPDESGAKGAADKQKYAEINKSIAELQARLDGLKKTAVSFAEELARYGNKGETNEFARRIAENREQATALERQFPGQRPAIEKQEYSNLAQINSEAKAEIAKFQAKLQSEGEKEAEQFYTEQIKQLLGPEKLQKQNTLNFRTGTGLTIEDYAQRYKASGPAFEGQIKGVSDTATQQMQALQLRQAIDSGAMARGRASGALTSQQLAGMDFGDQLQFILRQSGIQQNEFGTQAQMYRSHAAGEFDPQKQAEDIAKATEAEAKAKEAETKATIEAVNAVNKFQEAAEEASAKLRDQFGSFISGLAAAGREGHAGTYTKNYMLGQSDKIISNFASSMYQPGMFELPGQGDAGSPMSKLLQGTMFGRDPKAHGGDAMGTANAALKSTTDLNTKATIDNTTVMAAVYEALGGDPTSLGLSNLPAIPSLTGGTSSVALPFFGAAGAAGAAGAGTLITSVLKSAGVSVPGLTTSSGASSTASGPAAAFTSLFRAFGGGGSSGPSASSQPGWTGIAAPPPGGYDQSSVSSATDSWSSMASDLDQLANGGSGTPSLSASMAAMARGGSLMTGPTPPAGFAPGSSSSSFFTASNPLTNLFNTNGTASTGQQVGAGLQLAGEAYGAYSGIRQATKGGAQNIIGGIGETAMSIAPLTGPAAPFVMAGGALMSMISSIMGNPVQERQAHINSELMNNQYIAPQAINRTMDISGGYADVNFQGNVRATDLSSVPIIQQAYADPRHGVIVPGTVISPFGGGGGPVQVPVGDRGAYTTDSGTGGHTVNVTNNVSAIDGDSVAQFFQNNSQALGDGIVTALNKGGTDLANRMRTL